MSDDLQAYREEQRRRFHKEPEPSLVPDDSLVRIHLLPLVSQLETPEMLEQDRLAAVTAILSSRTNSLMQGGQVLDGFVVAKTEPENGGNITGTTDFYVSGPPVVELSKIQFLALVNEDGADENMEDTLFRESIGPWLEQRLETGGCVVHPNQVITVGPIRYICAALEPPTANLGLITKGTTVYVDAERSGDYARIHILPFQDTLPRVYDFDVFEDYLKPYFSNNPGTLYSVNTQFVFRGVQFKVVSVDPADGRPRRIGPNTLIHCEGLLHASLRNMLPPELLEQLSALPPGLQMLLINTELLGSVDVLDRFMDLQETLASRRGVSEETLAAIAVEQFDPRTMDSGHRPESTVQCMICLSEFEAGESLRRLPCAHVYHQPCIDEWLRRCTDCPLCKTNVERAIRGNS